MSADNQSSDDAPSKEKGRAVSVATRVDIANSPLSCLKEEDEQPTLSAVSQKYLQSQRSSGDGSTSNELESPIGRNGPDSENISVIAAWHENRGPSGGKDAMQATPKAEAVEMSAKVPKGHLQKQPRKEKRSKSASWSDRQQVILRSQSGKRRFAIPVSQVTPMDYHPDGQEYDYDSTGFIKGMKKEKQTMQCAVIMNSIVVMGLMTVFFVASIFMEKGYDTVNRLHAQSFLLLVIFLLFWTQNSMYRRVKDLKATIKYYEQDIFVVDNPHMRHPVGMPPPITMY